MNLSTYLQSAPNVLHKFQQEFKQNQAKTRLESQKKKKKTNYAALPNTLNLMGYQTGVSQALLPVKLLKSVSKPKTKKSFLHPNLDKNHQNPTSHSANIQSKTFKVSDSKQSVRCSPEGMRQVPT